MRFRQLLVNLQCPPGSRTCARHELFRGRIFVAAHKSVGLTQAGIGTSVTGIFVNSLLKILDRLLQTLRRSLVPEVTALEISLIGIGLNYAFLGSMRVRWLVRHLALDFRRDVVRRSALEQ